MKKVKINVKNIDGLKLPVQAKPFDAGYDVFATSGPRVNGIVEVGGEDEKNWVYSDIVYIEYGIGLFISPQDAVDYGQGFFGGLQKYWCKVFPRSSISKYNLLMCNSFGTIDTTYRGEILIRYAYRSQPKDLVPLLNQDGKLYGFGVKIDYKRIYKVGDAIAQIQPVENIEIEWNVVTELDQTIRGDGGFGNSGNNSAT